MEQSATSIIMIMLVVFVFIPALFMGMLQANRQKINEAMYLSTKCLQDGVETTEYSLDEIAQGYGYSDDPIMRIRIDEAKVFTEFDTLLYQNINNPEQFAKIKNDIVCEMIIYPDRFVTWNKAYSENGSANSTYYFSDTQAMDEYLQGERDKYVSVPKYFTWKNVKKTVDVNGVIEYGQDENLKLYNTKTGTYDLYYLNATNDKIRKIGDNSAWRNIDTYITSDFIKSQYYYSQADDAMHKTTDGYSKKLTTYDKNQMIIDILNKEISLYTDGVMMDFVNPASAVQKERKAEKQDFNFFTGITFLVIYRNDRFLNLQSDIFHFNQYTAAGFTLEN